MPRCYVEQIGFDYFLQNYVEPGDKEEYIIELTDDEWLDYKRTAVAFDRWQDVIEERLKDKQEGKTE